MYRFETVAVTKKQVEEMKVAEVKMLRFAMRETRKDKIKNEYIRGTVQAERLRMKMREGRLRWYGHVMRRDQELPGWNMDGNRVTGKEEKRETKKKSFRCSEGRYGKVGAREKNIENRRLRRSIIRCDNP